MASDKGDGAIGTMAVATLGNLYVGIMAGSGNNACIFRRGTRGQSFLLHKVTDHLPPVKLTIVSVDSRDFLVKLLIESLRQAPHHQNFLKSSLLLESSQLQYHIDALLLGVVDKTAGVNNGHVAMYALRIMIHAESCCPEPIEQTLRINKIL